MTAFGSQQLADDVDGAGSPTNEKEKEKPNNIKIKMFDLFILTFG